jgi:hypothetical protein
MKKIILLDIDGVLVKPGGYRAAVRGVMEYFSALMGIEPPVVSDSVLNEFEAQGITSEWDMLPLLIAALWQEILTPYAEIPLPTDLREAAAVIGRLAVRDRVPSLKAPDVDPTLHPYPAEAALRQGLFPAIPQNLREQLLSHTRDPYCSVTTRLFQQFVLGSEQFAKTYQLTPEVKSDSCLKKHDQSLLTREVQEEIERLSQREDLYLGSITARPSLPPREVRPAPPAYPPEAEMALEAIGFPGMTVIGFGKLKYVGERFGFDPEVLLKPSAVQTLAAIAALNCGEEFSAIERAVNWQKNGELNGILACVPAEFELHVVEDTLGGVRSVRAASRLLAENGVSVRVYAWGMTGDNREKTRVMEAEGVKCFPNWGALLAATRNFDCVQGEG